MTDADYDRIVGRTLRQKDEATGRLARLRCKAVTMREEAVRVAIALEHEHLAEFMEEHGFSISSSPDNSIPMFEKCAYPTAEEVVEILREIRKTESEITLLSKKLVSLRPSS